MQTPGDQDAEDTQLMAIYAKDSQTEDKVGFFLFFLVMLLV